jgi:hypothetical protein
MICEILLLIIFLSKIVLTTLDNTFFGTLFAGLLIAKFGLFLYQKQKKIDIQYEERNHIRELAASLFGNLGMASSNFRGQLNLYSGENQQLEAIGRAINAKYKNNFCDGMQNKFIQYNNEIEKSLNNLISQLKLSRENDYTEVIKILTEKIPTLNLYMLSNLILEKLDKNEIKDIRNSFEENLQLINDVLKNLKTKNS